MTQQPPTSLAPRRPSRAGERRNLDIPLSPEILQRATKREFFDALGYRPHRGQMRIHRAKARFIVAICGRRWGKTLAAAREAEYAAMQPNARVYVVAPYQHLATRVFFQIWRDLILRLHIPMEAKSRSELYLRLPWNAVIEGRSADRPENLVGEGLDFIVFDEAAKARGDVWQQYLAPSLMDKRGRALFISTPEGFNWLHRLYMLGRTKKRSGAARDWHAFASPSTQNPYLPREELVLASRLLSDFAYRQEILAEFTRCENLVYPAFSHERHVKPLAYDPQLPLYRALDFGYVNPFVCLTIQVAPDDTVRVLDEIYLRGRTLSELAELMQQSLAPYFEAFRKFWLSSPHTRSQLSASSFQLTGERIAGLKADSRQLTASLTNPLTGAQRFPQNLAQFNESIIYFCDPSGAGERAALRDLGFFTQAKPSPLNLGIELIRRALGSGYREQVAGNSEAPSTDACNLSPAPCHLLVGPSCLNLIREFTSYRYATEGAPDPSSLTPDPSRSESPLKASDHALDALRYFFVGMSG